MVLHKKSIEELHDMLVSKELTVVELIESTFEYIDSIEKEIGAFISTNKEAALEKAKAIDERGVDPDNVFDGIPIAIKDNIVMKEGKTTAASKMLENFSSVYDATIVEKVNDAGMIIVGKNNMDEFAMGGTTENSYFHDTKNPWDTTKVPGGSSGGSAAAVAAGMVPVSIGTDTGGSVRQPAAFNNLVGIKPTYGTISRYGIIAFASSLDQAGPLTRTAKDNALMMNLLSGRDDKDNTSAEIDIDYTEKIGKDIKGLKVGVPYELFHSKVLKEDVREKVNQAVEKLKELGAEIVEINLPNLKYSVAAYYIIASAEASSNLQRFDGIRYGYHAEDPKSLDDLYVRSRTEGFGPEVRRRIIIGSLALSTDYYDRFYGEATKVRTILRNDYEKALEQVDVIVGPSMTRTAPSLGDVDEKDPAEEYMDDIFTVSVNLTGVPALSLPVGFSNGLPVGMQVIGNYFDEATLYQVANAFQEVTDYHKQYPEIEGGVN